MRWVLTIIAAAAVGQDLCPKKDPCDWSKLRVALDDAFHVNYDRFVRPSSAACNGSAFAKAEEVYMKFQLIHVGEVSTHAQTLKVTGTLHSEWRDFRLDVSDHFQNCTPANGRHEFHVSHKVEDAWLPTIAITNLAKKPDIVAEHLTLSEDGHIILKQLFVLDLICDMFVGRLPYDKHKCGLTIHALANVDDLHLNPHWDDDVGVTAGDVEPFAKHLEWRIGNGGERWQRKGTASTAVLPSGERTPILKLDWRMRRLPYSYLLEVLSPAYILVHLSYVGFYLDTAAAPARVAISVTPTLILMTLLRSHVAQLPRISYRVWLTSYLNVLLWLSCLCILEYGIVAVFLRKEKRQRDSVAALRAVGRTKLIGLCEAADDRHGHRLFELLISDAHQLTQFKTQRLKVRDTSFSLSSSKRGLVHEKSKNEGPTKFLPATTTTEDDDGVTPEKDKVSIRFFDERPSEVDITAEAAIDKICTQVGVGVCAVPYLRAAALAFQRSDKDGDGKVSVSEVTAALATFGCCHAADRQIAAALARLRNIKRAETPDVWGRSEAAAVTFAEFLLITTDLTQYIPPPRGLKEHALNLPPSKLTDVVCRWLFPLITLANFISFNFLLHSSLYSRKVNHG